MTEESEDKQDKAWKGKAAMAGAAIGSAALAAALLYTGKRKTPKNEIKPTTTSLPPETD